MDLLWADQRSVKPFYCHFLNTRNLIRVIVLSFKSIFTLSSDDFEVSSGIYLTALVP